MSKRIAVVVSALCLLLVGCGHNTDPTGQDQQDSTHVVTVVVNGETVHCVVWDSVRAGGIDCNWGDN